MKPRIAIVGKGSVGSALEKGFAASGYEVRMAGRDIAAARDAATWADAVIVATPYAATDDVLRALDDAVNGKLLVDATNPLTPDFRLAIGFTTSAAEEMAKKAPRARVVKAFNTVFAPNMSTGKVKGEKLTLLVAGDDAAAKKAVLTMGADIGFDPVDAGPLTNARWLEAVAYLNVQLGYMLKMGTDIGIRVVH